MTEDALQPQPEAVRRSFGRAVVSYDEAAVLQAEVGRRLVERLSLLRDRPQAVLDVGAGTGYTTAALMRACPKARVAALDVAPAMLRRARRQSSWLRRLHCIGGDATALPLADDSVDLLFSNLALQWVGDLDAAFTEFQRVLRPGGALLFSSFGPDTLQELRASWAAVDESAHVNRFIDLHDIGDALNRARLVEPVMDMEHITMTYPSVRALMRDLKAIGAHNVAAGRRRGLTVPRQLRAMETAYEAYRDGDGRLPATWEVVYGHAWGSDARTPLDQEPGIARVPLDQISVRRRGEGA